MTIWRYTWNIEAYQWDQTDSTFLKVMKALPRGWFGVTTQGVLIVFKEGPVAIGDPPPTALCCPQGWWLSVDGDSVQLLRPENFPGHYQRVEG